MAASNPASFDYNACARSQIFKREAPKAASVTDVQRLIRYNEYQTDPVSQHDPALAVSSRYDLRPGPRGAAFGAVDAKVSSFQLLAQAPYAALALSGPTTEGLSQTPPFSWADPRFANASKVGQPVTWNFSWATLPRKQPWN
mmetsp:Transcript_40765/g.80001  ORF Transcript_40765/g.80001 Transcript_40765/m.80001 type:complete len:142 (-) Transcript_40765:243-668(-)